jgi:hypothetical protein
MQLVNLVFTLFVQTFLFDLVRSSELINLLQSKKNIIYLNEKSMQTIRLKSILNLQNQNVTSSKSQKLFWSFKRIYSIPNMYETNLNDVNNLYVKTTSEMSQNEIMISLDGEVQDNLKSKYAISEESDENDAGDSSTKSDKFDLIIYNLTYADSGLYKCNLWNQKTLYYHIVVSSNYFYHSFF